VSGAFARGGIALLAYLLIAVGSALGGMARYFLSGVVSTVTGGVFPWGTMVVNVTGALVIGFFATFAGPDGRLWIGSAGRQFMLIGICGGYTTFSTFSLETLNLIRDGEWTAAGANAVLSMVLCLLAVWFGHIAAAGLNRFEGV
jgi:fluoride exporter